MQKYLFAIAFVLHLHLISSYSVCCPPNTFEKLGRCVCERNTARKPNGKCEPCLPDERYFTPSAEVDYIGCESCGLYFHPEEASMCIKCPLGQVIIDDSGECGVCPPGFTFKPPPKYVTFSDRRTADCVPCEPGLYKNAPGLHPCTPCPPGRSSGIGATYCKPCLFNQKIMFTGKCGKCPPGHFLSQEYLRCRPCPMNTYQPNRSAAWECMKCPPGEQAVEGATKCIKCPKRNFLMKYSEKCESCDPGTYYSKDDMACWSCAAGWFSNKNTSPTKCVRCPEGKTSRDGAGKCQDCPPGQFLLENNECGKCPSGETFSNGYCSSCNSGTFNDRNSGNKCEKCPEGTSSIDGSTRCVRCPAGKVLLGDGSCGECDPGYEYTTSAHCSYCSENKYSNSSTAFKCKKCPTGTFSEYASANCTRCPKGTVLISDYGKKARCGTCGTGYEYYKPGHFCSKCGIQHYSNRTSNFRCKMCPCDQFAMDGSSECITCPKGQVLLESGVCGICGPGFQYHRSALFCEKCDRDKYSNKSTANVCVRCPSGTTSLPGASKCTLL